MGPLTTPLLGLCPQRVADCLGGDHQSKNHPNVHSFNPAAYYEPEPRGKDGAPMITLGLNLRITSVASLRSRGVVIT
jgi:hypothetical protein